MLHFLSLYSRESVSYMFLLYYNSRTLQDVLTSVFLRKVSTPTSAGTTKTPQTTTTTFSTAETTKRTLKTTGALCFLIVKG